MKIETRFDLDQLVWRVGRVQHKDSDACPACGSAGRIAVTRLDGTEQMSYCENCNGRGVIHEIWYDLYEIIDQSRIGQITVKYSRKRLHEHDSLVEEAYMIDSTGVGSGSVHALRDSVWSHSHMFATEMEALAFCAAENPSLLAEVEAQRAKFAVPA